MASAGLGHGGAGSSRSANGLKVSSSSVEWLGKEMLEMRLRDRVDTDDDRVHIYMFIDLHLLLLSSSRTSNSLRFFTDQKKKKIKNSLRFYICCCLAVVTCFRV